MGPGCTCRAPAPQTPEVTAMPFDDLRARYLDNRLVVFAGAGVSAAGGLPSWSGLIQHVLVDARAAASAAEFPALDEAEATLTRGDMIRALGEVQASTTSRGGKSFLPLSNTYPRGEALARSAQPCPVQTPDGG